MSKVIKHILMAFSGNFDGGDGDVLDSAGTLTFDHPKITGQDQRPAGVWVRLRHDQCSPPEKSEKC